MNRRRQGIGRKLLVLGLEFSAGIAGNLLAGWLQDSVWSGFFTPWRIAATLGGALLVLIAIALIDRELSTKKGRQIEIGLSATSGAQQTGSVDSGATTRADHYDAFISYASEDRDDFVAPLVSELRRRGFVVWYDQCEMSVGDSLRETVDRGLALSDFGIVVLSPASMGKTWPRHELNALFAKGLTGKKVILPIWYGVTETDLLASTPLLADKYAVRADGMTISEVASVISSALER